MGVLTIYLDKCTDLTNKDFLSASDPYVILELEQDNWVRFFIFSLCFAMRRACLRDVLLVFNFALALDQSSSAFLAPSLPPSSKHGPRVFFFCFFGEKLLSYKM